MQIIYRLILSLLLALQLSLADAVVGASTLIEGGGEVITGKDQLNGIELALVANGTPTEDAEKYSNWIETGVAVITIVNGVAIVSKVKGASKGTLASIDDFATNTGANNINNGIKLNHQLAAEEIANGHGFQKHALEQGEFAGLGIRTGQQYQNHVESVLNNPSSVRYTSDGRSFHLQESTGTVVVRNPSAPDGGTAFQPQNWNEYVSGFPTRAEPY